MAQAAAGSGAGRSAGGGGHGPRRAHTLTLRLARTPRTHTHTHAHTLAHTLAHPRRAPARPPAGRPLGLRAARPQSRHRGSRRGRRRRRRRRSRPQAPLEPLSQLQRRAPLEKPGPGPESELEPGPQSEREPGIGAARATAAAAAAAAVPAGALAGLGIEGSAVSPSRARGEAAGGDQGALVSGGQVQGRTQPAIQEGSAGEREAASEEDHTLCSFCCTGGAGLSLPSSFGRQAQAGAQRRRVTKPPPAAAGGCGAARLPAAPRLWRASKLSQLQHPRASTSPQVKGGGLGEALRLRGAFCASRSLSSPTESQEPGDRLVSSDDAKEQNKGFPVSCPPAPLPRSPSSSNNGGTQSMHSASSRPIVRFRGGDGGPARAPCPFSSPQIIAPKSPGQLKEYKGRQSRAEEAGREGDREKEKRTWKETERVQEAARSERQGTGGSPRLDAPLSGPAALGPRTGSLGRQKPEPAHLCRTRPGGGGGALGLARGEGREELIAGGPAPEPPSPRPLSRGCVENRDRGPRGRPGAEDRAPPSIGPDSKLIAPPISIRHPPPPPAGRDCGASWRRGGGRRVHRLGNPRRRPSTPVRPKPPWRVPSRSRCGGGA
ncbi:zinc finger protein 579-like [Budorcas taxicolor]|uniref:zinc finger protein 579-like n=1 Tax=Budorcas taxicolor TaxID=37181 RepID=UPI002284BB75|nr:zinc finger protein 579-like [Budorcas taxicolor]